MPANALPLNTLGAIENNGGSVTFGVWLPWVSAPDSLAEERQP